MAHRKEVAGNNRSVMPLDVLGCTRATLEGTTSFISLPGRVCQSLNTLRDWDRPLQLLVFNEEFLVNARQQRALITSLPFVHTARRSYRLNVSMSYSEEVGESVSRNLHPKFRKSEHLEEGEVVTRFP